MRILAEPNPILVDGYCGTMGHVMGLSAATADPSRVGGLVETAHAVLADWIRPMKWALLWLWVNSGACISMTRTACVTTDRAFGAENLRQMLHQVMILKENGYGKNGEFIGLMSKLRTQKWNTVISI